MNNRRRIEEAAESLHLRALRLPRIVRLVLGTGLVIGGLFGFLPILGVWMIPVGLAVLAIDIPLARRLWVRMVNIISRWEERREKKAEERAANKEAANEEAANKEKVRDHSD